MGSSQPPARPDGGRYCDGRDGTLTNRTGRSWNATTFPGAALIRVPAVEIAGLVVGPAWFESRPGGVFERGLSRAMDRPIVGALGGNVLGHFRVTVDYPGAVAIFETP